MFFFILIPVFILAAIGLYIFFGGKRLSSTDGAILEFPPPHMPDLNAKIVAHVEASGSSPVGS